MIKKLWLSQDQVRHAISQYLNKEVFKTRVVVESVTVGYGNVDPTYEILLADTQPIGTELTPEVPACDVSST